MGRKKKDIRFEVLKETLKERIVNEKDPKIMGDLLIVYNRLIDTIEREHPNNKNTELIKIKLKAQQLAKKAFPVIQKCSIIGCTGLGERHHEDYAKPLEITWFCQKHHRKRHKELSLN